MTAFQCFYYLFFIPAFNHSIQPFVVVIAVNTLWFVLFFTHCAPKTNWRCEDEVIISLPAVKKCGNCVTWSGWVNFATKGQSVKFLMSSVCWNFFRKALLALASPQRLHFALMGQWQASWRDVFMAPCGSIEILGITHRLLQSREHVWDACLLWYLTGICQWRKTLSTSPATPQFALFFFFLF